MLVNKCGGFFLIHGLTLPVGYILHLEDTSPTE